MFSIRIRYSSFSFRIPVSRATAVARRASKRRLGRGSITTRRLCWLTRERRATDYSSVKYRRKSKRKINLTTITVSCCVLRISCSTWRDNESLAPQTAIVIDSASLRRLRSVFLSRNFGDVSLPSTCSFQTSRAHHSQTRRESAKERSGNTRALGGFLAGHETWNIQHRVATLLSTPCRAMLQLQNECWWRDVKLGITLRSWN